MWVMIREMVPTSPFPMKMGIYWAVPWPNLTFARQQAGQRDYRPGSGPRLCSKSAIQAAKAKREKEAKLVDPEEEFFASDNSLGVEPNWAGALAIMLGPDKVRVFPHEVSKLKPENMQLYVFGSEKEDPSHEFIPGDVASQNLFTGVLDGDNRPIYDAALVDGCTEAQALHVALGGVLDTDYLEFSPLGWYRPKQETLNLFCRDWELQRITAAYGTW